MTIAPDRTVKDEVTDFLASAPSTEQILAYRLPDALQQRAQYLLDKNREAGLMATEQQEMDDFAD